MILAGDIGGSKTLLALYETSGGALRPVRQEQLASRALRGLEAAVGDFLRRAAPPRPPLAAAFAVAGPIRDARVQLTNLDWGVDAARLARSLGIERVQLLNDVEATAVAAPRLPAHQLCVLQRGQPEPTGNLGVVAPGTGLGEAFLIRDGQRYRAFATEGGHASFAPVTERQRALLDYLAARYGHVSVERSCAGGAVPDLYRFLLAGGAYEEPAWLADGIREARDPTPLILSSGLAARAPIATATLDLFIENLAVALGNAALNFFTTGGLYLGGGIGPRILRRLQRPDLLALMRHKGRFGQWLERIPLIAILDPGAGLYGAAIAAREALDR